MLHLEPKAIGRSQPGILPPTVCSGPSRSAHPVRNPAGGVVLFVGVGVVVSRPASNPHQNTVPNTARPSLIYFFDARDDERFIYVGFDGSSRIADHRRQGSTLLAVMRGSKDYEKRIHRHFADLGHLASGEFPGTTSVYHGQAIWDYVAWLLRGGRAAQDEKNVCHLPRLPWGEMSPKRVTAYHEDEHGQLSLVPAGRRERVTQAAAAAYHMSGSDEWYTPTEIVESARAVLCGIDLDPASCPVANERVQARWFFSQQVDGLKQAWRGDEPDGGGLYRCSVWMNPPYSSLAPQFARRLVHEHASGNVTEAIALFNANAMSSRWFSVVYGAATRLMVTRGRLRFSPGDPEQSFSSPSTGSVIAYFGSRPDVFAQEFKKHGTVMAVVQGSTDVGDEADDDDGGG